MEAISCAGLSWTSGLLCLENALSTAVQKRETTEITYRGGGFLGRIFLRLKIIGCLGNCFKVFVPSKSFAVCYGRIIQKIYA